MMHRAANRHDRQQSNQAVSHQWNLGNDELIRTVSEKENGERGHVCR